MKDTWIMQGSAYRAKLSKYTFSDHITYHVAVLPQTYHKSTAYAIGIHIYHGSDLSLAIAAIQRYIPDASIPDHM